MGVVALHRPAQVSPRWGSSRARVEVEGSSREHTRPRAPQKQPVGTPAGLPAQYDDSIVDDATPGRRHVCAPMVWNSELGETTPFRVWDLGFSIEVFYGTRSGVRRNPLRTHSLSLVYRFCGMASFPGVPLLRHGRADVPMCGAQLFACSCAGTARSSPTRP